LTIRLVRMDAAAAVFAVTAFGSACVLFFVEPTGTAAGGARLRTPAPGKNITFTGRNEW
jgi:hypothetical protein